MAGWRGATYPDAYEADDGGGGVSGAFKGALEILWGWVRIPLIMIATCTVIGVLIASGVFSLGAKSCYICGQPVKIGYTLTVKRNFSIQETAKKVSASFKGDTQDAPEASRRYDLCDDCRNNVLSSLASARNGGSQ